MEKSKPLIVNLFGCEFRSDQDASGEGWSWAAKTGTFQCNGLIFHLNLTIPDKESR